MITGLPSVVADPPPRPRDASRPAPLLAGLPMAARVCVAVAAGFSLFLSFPPVSLWWLAPLAIAAVTVAVTGLRWGRAALVGYVAGLAFYLPLVTWIDTAVGTVPWLLLSAGCALFWALLGAGLATVARFPGAPLWGALTWVAVEAVQSRVPFGGFPWGRVAFGQADGPFLGLAALGGSPAVTFGVALFGGLLAGALLGLPGAPRAVWGVGAVALAVVPVLAPGGPAGISGRTGASGDPPVGTATIALVQGNVPRLGLDFNAQAQAVLRNHVTETLALADDVRAGLLPQPDLVIWPENSVDVDPFRRESARRLVSSAAASVGVPIVVGAIMDGPTPGTRRNVTIVWDPVSGPGEVYDKRRPAPFAEYLPLRRLALAVSDKAELVGRDVVAGDEPGVLPVGRVTVGVTICYELAFDPLVRDVVTGGAQVLVLQNNSATFGRSAESHQQLAQARLRAVEHDRATLAVTTSGVSAVIAPDGTVEQRTEIFTPAVLVAQVPLRETQTLADRLGAWPEWVACLALASAALVAAARRRRT